VFVVFEGRPKGINKCHLSLPMGALQAGHGGITDRMDCQMVMAVFSHLYITNFIRQPGQGLTLVHSSAQVKRCLWSRATLGDVLGVFRRCRGALGGM
jgi:hypothetical protein